MSLDESCSHLSHVFSIHFIATHVHISLFNLTLSAMSLSCGLSVRSSSADLSWLNTTARVSAV